MITNPKATISGQQVSISADVYQTCKSFSPRSGSLSVLALSPSYTVNLTGVTCTGPMLKSELLSLPSLGYVLGNVRCSGTTTSYGSSSSVINASTAEGTVTLTFSHTLIATPAAPKPVQTSPAQSTPTQTTPTQNTGTPASPTQSTTTYVESPETTNALKDLEVAYQEVLSATNLADSAEAKLTKFIDSLKNSMTVIQYLLDAAKERIASLIELVQRIQSKTA